MSKSVYLSPSLQEHNVGVCGYGTEEAMMNRVADVTQRVLEANGVVCYRNRTDWTLEQVIKDSNAKRPDLHFAIHSNAGGGRGCEIYAYAPGGNGEKAARAIYAEIEPLTPSTDRGVKFNPKLYELNATTAPAVLVEIAFHDNAEDAAWIMGNVELIGTALAKGVLKHLGIEYKEEKKNTDNNEEITRLTNEAIAILQKVLSAIN